MNAKPSGKTRIREEKEMEYLCDGCNIGLGKSYYNFSLDAPIELNTEYQDYNDHMGSKYYFCSTKCFKQYCRNNLNNYCELSLSGDETNTVTVRLTIKEFKERFLYNE